ncbi:MAG: diguanylate cyclase [Deltaproteobacteria bacterium RIFOXYD12_FULL_57_12]|nr:MAG: diguanylate cyclase [Deltaproteobacteria bacterium RIFOXYD12_FULL_57_12]
MIFEQIFNMINVGLVVLDADLRVRHWNRWMELHSGISAESIVGEPIFSFYPDLNNPKFIRNCKAVLKFGNFAFFSQKLHSYLFPLKPASSFGHKFNNMQQGCTMGPLRDQDNIIRHLYISVQDVTEVVAYEQKLVAMNMQDGLTGVYNRRFLEGKLKEEFGRHKRYARPFGVIMCDIDFFKKVNDTYGHQCGDQVLKYVAATIQKLIRDTDYLARYGGEEFCCLLPEADLEAARKLAERLRQGVARGKTSCGDQEVEVTVSFGVAAVGPAIETPETLLALADQALYEAKRAGRNRVVVCPD